MKREKPHASLFSLLALFTALRFGFAFRFLPALAIRRRFFACLFFRVRMVVVVGVRLAPRRGFIIGGVKPRTFEDNLSRRDDFPQRFLFAFGTGL